MCGSGARKTEQLLIACPQYTVGAAGNAGAGDVVLAGSRSQSYRPSGYTPRGLK